MASSSQLLETYYSAKQSLAGGDLRRAQELCKQILDADPEFAYGYFLMAMLFKATGNIEKAVLFVDIAIKADTKNAEFYTLAAELFFYAKEFLQAELMARNALSLKPDDIEAMEQLFAALREQNKAEESNRLMVRLLELQALKANKEIGADIKHFKDVASGLNMKTAPKKFVESHFDGYAPFFDEHLQNTLHYHIPEMVAEVLQPLALLKSGTALSLLDLGCGTGLMAAALEAKTALRVGVDLSQGMLERAREKELYDELHKADIVSFMKADSRIFDLIVATDVFIYVGDLIPVFESAFKKLTPSGLFAFSIEVNDGVEPYLLNPADRYSHSIAYIENTVMQMGYELLINKDCFVRTENDNPVKGSIMVIRKPKKTN